MAVFILLLIPLLLLRTVIRNTNWYSEYTISVHDIQYSRDSAALENALANEYTNMGQFREAEQHFRRALELQPDWAMTWNNIAVMYERSGRLDAAETGYRKAILLKNSMEAYTVNLAIFSVKYRKPEIARTFIDTALKKYPDNYQLWYLSAVTSEKLGDHTTAETKYYRAQQLAPK